MPKHKYNRIKFIFVSKMSRTPTIKREEDADETVNDGKHKSYLFLKLI